MLLDRSRCSDGLLLSATLTLVLAHTAHSETRMMVATAILISLRLRFIATILLLSKIVRLKYKHVKIDCYGIYLRIFVVSKLLPYPAGQTSCRFMGLGLKQRAGPADCAALSIARHDRPELNAAGRRNHNRNTQPARPAKYATDLHAHYKCPKFESVARIPDYPVTA